MLKSNLVNYVGLQEKLGGPGDVAQEEAYVLLWVKPQSPIIYPLPCWHFCDPHNSEKKKHLEKGQER